MTAHMTTYTAFCVLYLLKCYLDALTCGSLLPPLLRQTSSMRSDDYIAPGPAKSHTLGE